MRKQWMGCLFLVAFATTTFAAPATAKKETATAKKTTTTAKAAAEKVTSVEGITEYDLPNGLRVLLFPDQTKPTVVINLTYLVGSRHESYGETGMAHLLEHMMFKGTPDHKNIPQALKEHGANYNASTWYDRTNYFEILPATAENVRFALELEADRMIHSFIARKDLDSEMTVVRNEFEMGENDPENVLGERVLSTAYLWHNYGHSTIGSRADIERVPIERLQAFWRKYYQPDNVVLLVAGKFDEAKTLAEVEKIYGSIPRPTRKLEEPYTAEPAQDGERSVTLRRVGDVQALAVAYHIPAESHPDSAAVEVLDRLLTDTPSGRLYKALVETKKATSVSSFLPGLHDPGFVILQAEVRQEQSLEDAKKIFLQTIDDLKATPPTKEEVDRARTGLLKNIDLTLNAADRVGLAMSESIAAGDWRLFFLNRDRIRKVTPTDVQRVANAYFLPSNRTVGEFIPDKAPARAEVPPSPDVAEMVKTYKGDAAIAAGEAFDPSPSNIESRTTRTTLPGGLKVALLPKKTRGSTVNVVATLHFGDEKSLMNRSTAGVAAADMLMRGTSKHTRQQIKDEIDRLKARVNVSGGAQANISVETTRENLPAVLALIGEVLRDPIFPPPEFSQWKQEELAQAEQQRSDPQSVGFTAFQRHMNPYPKGDIRYVSTAEEDIADLNALTIDDVKSFYTTFYGASNAEIALVGDFDPKQVIAQLTDLVGSWKSGTPFVRVPRLYNDTPATNQSLETPDKANAVFVAGQNLVLRDDDPDYPALILGNYILGGGTLYSRLGNRIRQKEGLSYGVGSNIQAGPFDKSGSFTTFAIYAPQNAAKLETAFKEEVDKAVKEGFTAAEIAEAKKGLLENRKLQRAQDAGLSRTLATELFANRTLAWDAAMDKKISDLTPEQVNAAVHKWIDPSKISIVKAGDFAKAAAAPKP
ncbi:MAG TPA: pitrilysin family protein [Thermoanaerobaculia bacterium]|jgi:zinc protease|nr:pitrilysin family protein [Thermoanaerobaculia bacterium]